MTDIYELQNIGSSSASAGNYVTRLYDGNVIDGWTLDVQISPLPVWIQFNFPLPFAVSRYQVWAEDVNHNTPKAWTITGSNDGLIWTVVDQRTNVSIPYGSNGLVFNVDAPPPIKYRMYRFNLTEINSEAAVAFYTGIGEVRFWHKYNDELPADSSQGAMIYAMNLKRIETSLADDSPARISSVQLKAVVTRRLELPLGTLSALSTSGLISKPHFRAIDGHIVRVLDPEQGWIGLFRFHDHPTH